MKAMISGPRYGSTSGLLRAADATRYRARRKYTPPFALFRGLEKKMCTHPKGGPARFRITNFRPGIFGEARCYTERSMTTRLGGCARTMASFITFVASCSETPFSSEGFGHYSVDQEPSANRAAKENFTKRIITEHSYFSSKRHGRFYGQYDHRASISAVPAFFWWKCQVHVGHAEKGRDCANRSSMIILFIKATMPFRRKITVLGYNSFREILFCCPVGGGLLVDGIVAEPLA